MPASGKRLDLRFGTFACSVQGFDDPVQPVQQILRAIQHLLEESPELADTAVNFDAEAIEQLIGEVARRAELDESEVEIVPGLVIVHHGSGGDLALDAAAGGAPWPTALAAGAADGAPEGGPAESWHKDAAPEESWREESWQDDSPADDTADRAGTGYVNIFSAAGRDAPSAEERGTADPDAGPEPEPEDLVARLRGSADSEDVDYGWDDAGEEAREDATGDDAKRPDGGPAQEAPGGAPFNVFATTDDDTAEPRDPGPTRNLFAATADERDDAPGPAEHPDPWQRFMGDGRAGSQAEAPDGPPEPGETDEPGEGYTAAGLAQRAEARTVPEMIVSAAAWMVLIRGQTQFTRREVLDVFDTIPGDHENTPEARIKGFGKAVRNGHLVMIEEGIFGLARDDLEYFQKLL